MPESILDYPGAGICHGCGCVRYWWKLVALGDKSSDGYGQACTRCGTRRASHG